MEERGSQLALHPFVANRIARLVADMPHRYAAAIVALEPELAVANGQEPSRDTALVMPLAKANTIAMHLMEVPYRYSAPILRILQEAINGAQ